MKVSCSQLIFHIEQNETLKPLLERGWSVPTLELPESTKWIDGARVTAKRHVFDTGDMVTFEISGDNLTDISLAYAGIIVDLEDVGLLPKSN